MDKTNNNNNNNTSPSSSSSPIHEGGAKDVIAAAGAAATATEVVISHSSNNDNSNNNNNNNDNDFTSTYIDYISRRVSISAISGGIFGSIYAMYEGHIVQRTAILSSFSCAMVATTCFSTERIVYYILQQQNNNNIIMSSNNDNDNYRKTLLLTSHAIGGCIGGTILGTLYIQKPIRGALVFTPIMLLIGTIQNHLEQLKTTTIS